MTLKVKILKALDYLFLLQSERSILERKEIVYNLDVSHYYE